MERDISRTNYNECMTTASTATTMNASTDIVDDMSQVFGQTKFRQIIEKSQTHKPVWYDANDTSLHRKHLTEQLKLADEHLHMIIVGGHINTMWNEYNDKRNEIKDIFQTLIKYEMKFCRQHNIEQHFWKILYYNQIEAIRRLLSSSATASKSSNAATPTIEQQRQQQQYHSVCMQMIDDGMTFFNEMINEICQTYEFQLDDFLDANGGRNLKGMKYVSLAIVSVQKLCMYIGDLLRYREMINENLRFDDASRWYIKAYQLIPSNGMPSNQLAIIALYNKRKFDAIFYYMRSLIASNPIKSAKESLDILFDELRKKYQANEARTIKCSTERNRRKSSEHFKREIWVHPTDGQLDYRTVFFGSGNDDGESLDSSDLYKKFIFHFSHVHGTLFTRVAPESLEKCMEQALKQFQELLNHRTPGLFTVQKMAQLFILNAFAVENSTRDKSSLSVPALIFMFAFVGVILRRIRHELHEILVSGANESIEKSSTSERTKITRIEHFHLPDIVDTSLAVLSMWSNWARQNLSLWSPTPILRTIHDFCQLLNLCVWDELSKMATTLAIIEYESNDFLAVRPSDAVPPPHFIKFRLPEEMFTLGKSDLLLGDYLYCPSVVIVPNAVSFARMKNIYDFCSIDLVYGERPMLKMMNETKFVSTNVCSDSESSSSNSQSNETSSSVLSHSNDEDDDDIRDDLKAIDTNEPALQSPPATTTTETSDSAETQTSSDEIQRLLQRKNRLEQSHKAHEQFNRYMQDILRQDNVDNIQCIEIRPKYLVPDTNCYIDFLDEIKQLINTYPLYHVIVPIVVLNELEGLAKGDASGLKQYNTPTKTTRQAHKALALLKNCGNSVKCATTKGSFLNSMAFTKETITSSSNECLNNDDKILLTVSNLTAIQSDDAMRMSLMTTTSNQPKLNLQRKVVLLTNDRNLKLKAIAQNIPVRELSNFIKWSGIKVNAKEDLQTNEN